MKSNRREFWRGLRDTLLTGLRAPLAVHPSDVGLFLHGGKLDAAIVAAQAMIGTRGAFEAVYTDSDDPWRSTRYRYQRRKYEALAALLPRGQRFGRVLDLGSGLGTMTRLLAPRADYALGLDVAQAAVDRATQASTGFANVEFRQADVAALPDDLDDKFDLIIVADTLYYLAAPTDAVLDTVVARIAGLLVDGGIVMVANHYFFPWDRETRLSRRIHDRFIGSPSLALVSEHRRPFFLASLLSKTARRLQ